MTAKSFQHGREIFFCDGVWLYRESMREVLDTPEPGECCRHCGKEFIQEYRDGVNEVYDPCIGKIPLAFNACCGHGSDYGYIQFVLFNKRVYAPKWVLALYIWIRGKVKP